MMYNVRIIKESVKFKYAHNQNMLRKVLFGGAYGIKKKDI